MPRTPTYDKLQTLAAKLQQEKGVKVRRTVGETLLQELSKDTVRHRLVTEATPGSIGPDNPSATATRCHALSQLWSSILLGAINVPQSITQGQVKAALTISDITLPHKLLVACMKKDAAHDDHGLAILKVTKASVRRLLNYCLNMLSEDVAIEMGGEAPMLDMLSYLCSLAEFVGCFKLHAQFKNILTEIIDRLSYQQEQDDAPVFAKAAGALVTLLSTCQLLGIDMHLCVSDVVTVVAVWCKESFKMLGKTSSRRAVSSEPLFRSVAILMNEHPDYAVGPLKRCGSVLLKYCKRIYPHTITLKAREDLNLYLLTHIHVAQVTGTIQGLLGGDLGNLGKATLTAQHLDDLLAMTIVGIDGIASGAIKKGRRSRDRAIKAPPSVALCLSNRERRHLELCARLLSLAQRSFLDHDAVTHTNIQSVLTSLAARSAKVEGKCDQILSSHCATCPPERILRSPWMEVVGRRLFEAVRPHLDTYVDEEAKESTTMKLFDPFQRFRHLKSMSLRDAVSVSTDDLLMALAVLGACAELFPAGECWISSSTGCWLSTVPTDDSTYGVVYARMGATDDLGFLLFLVSVLLQAYGGQGGNTTIQTWLLVTLAKLAEGTQVSLFLHEHHDKVADECVRFGWQRIWSTLLRSDLQYFSSTTDTSVNSMGDLTIKLLATLASMKSPLALKEADAVTIWRLPVFLEPERIRSCSVFYLVSSVLRSFGLTDIGFDAIGHKEFQQIVEDHTGPNSRSRRHKLLCFSISCFQKFRASSRGNEESDDEIEMGVAKIVAVILLLVFGSHEANLQIDSQGSGEDADSVLLGLESSKAIQLTSVKTRGPRSASKHNRNTSMLCEVLNQFWGVNRASNPEHEGLVTSDNDVVAVVARTLNQKQTHFLRRSQESQDFVSKTESDTMQDMLSAILKSSRTSLPESDIEDDDDLPDETLLADTILEELMRKKLVYSLQLVGMRQRSTDKSKIQTDMTTLLGSFFSKFFELDPGAGDAREKGSYNLLIVELSNFTSGLSCLFGADEKSLTQFSLDHVASTCVDKLRQFKKCARQGLSLVSMKRARRDSLDESDDEFEPKGERPASVSRLAREQHESSGNKRRRSEVRDSKERKRRRREAESTTGYSIPSTLCAKEVGSILLSIAPTIENYKLVCETLLGVDVDIDPGSVDGDMDLRFCLPCIRLLLDCPLWHCKHHGSNDSSSGLSPGVLLCSIIEMLRACVVPSSKLFGYGCEVITEMLEVMNKSVEGGNQFVNIILRCFTELLSESRHLYARAKLRGKWTASVISAFEHGNKDFKEKFDKCLMTCIKSSVQDSSFNVRRLALKSVSLLMQLYDEKLIVESMYKLTAPLTCSSNEGTVAEEFSQWYDDDESYSMADDAFLVMVSDAVFCRSLVAANTEELSVFRGVLGLLTALSYSRQDLGAVALQAFERIATLRGFSNAEQMVESEKLSLAVNWSKGSFAHLPLVASSPSLQRAQLLFSRGCDPDNVVKDGLMVKLAEKDFVNEGKHLLVPLVLLQLLFEHKTECKSNEDAMVVLQQFQAHHIINHLLPTSDSNDRASATRFLLQQHTADIQAFSMCLERNCPTATRKVVSSLSFILNAAEQTSDQCAAGIVWRVITLTGKPNPFLPGEFLIPESFDAIKSLIEDPASREDAFLDKGINMVDLTLRTFWLLSSVHELKGLQEAWKMILLIYEIVEDYFESYQNGHVPLTLLVHCLVETLIQRRFYHIHTDVLNMLWSLLKTVWPTQANADAKLELQPIMKRLVGACFVTHEKCQFELLRNLVSSRSGISAPESEGSPVENLSSQSLYLEHLKLTFQMLSWILDNKGLFGLSPFAFACTFPPHSLSASHLELLDNFSSGSCFQWSAKEKVEVFEKELQDDDDIVSQVTERMNEKLEDRRIFPVAQLNAATYDNFFPKNGAASTFQQFSLDQRLAYSEIALLQRMLSSLPRHNLAGLSSPRLISFLSALCNENHPEDTRFAASRCLQQFRSGLLSRSRDENITVETDWIEKAVKNNILHAQIRAHCLDAVASCLKSPNPQVSVVASAVLANLTSSETGKRSLPLLPIKHRRIIELYKERIAGIEKSTDSEVLRATTLNSNPSTNEDLWCFGESMWASAQESTFESWICNATPALIRCCFSNTQSQDSYHCAFMWSCQDLCRIEPRFSSTVFPFLVFFLTEKDDLSSMTSGRQDLIQRKLSNCFDELITKAALPRQTRQLSIASKQVQIVVDTLGFLCRVSQIQFQEKEHRRNPSPKIKLPGDKGYSCDAPIPANPRWKGTPFGVKLPMSVLSVTKACLECNRYSSTLFYMDIHLNSRYGSSGGFLEKISEYDGNSGETDSIARRQVRDPSSTLPALETLCKSYEQLHNIEELESVWKSFEAQDLLRPGSLSRNSNDFVAQGELAQSRFSANNRRSLRYGKVLQNLGLDEALIAYAEKELKIDIMSNVIDDEDRVVLREMWFESQIRQVQWSGLASHSKTSASGGDSLPGRGSGFFECIQEGLCALRLDNKQECYARTRAARLQVLNEVGGAVEGEYPDLVLFSLIDKLDSVSLIEEAVSSDGVGQSIPTSQSSRSPSLCADESVSQMGGFTAIVKEILLQDLLKKSISSNIPSSTEARDSLKRHQRLSSDAAFSFGNFKQAEECIHRIQYLLGQKESSNGQLEMLELRLQEARILEATGNFQGAIHKGELVIRHLMNECRASNDIDLSNISIHRLLTDAQVDCGKWLSKYKVKQGDVVLETYLQPGADRAVKIRNLEKSVENIARACKASLELGHMVSNLYDALCSRIRSPAWKQTLATIQHQEEEAQMSRTMYEEKVTKKEKRSTEDNQYIHELLTHYTCLERELNASRLEVDNVKASMKRYFELSIDSFGSAFHFADPASDQNLDSHLFRFISLWFDTSAESSKKINVKLKNAFQRIPTFWFVPLCNQLFSRVDDPTAEGCDEHFQDSLHYLIFKMCKDHPYHCLVPLIALSNGRKVGGGVSGRSASTFLENVGDSKVTASISIQERLKKDSRRYVRDLLQSYSQVSDAYIHLANAPTADFEKKTTRSIPFKLVTPRGTHNLATCLKDAPAAPGMFTAKPILRADTDYGAGTADPIGGERITGFDETFNITETGLHRPKIVFCQGSKGTRFRQLVKGEDEIRQDAIMNQVFTFVNKLMRQRQAPSHRGNAHSNFPRRKDHLKMVTYCVVPLTPASGVIEWVEDTMAFGDFIQDSKRTVQSPKKSRNSSQRASSVAGGHSKYYPGEWSLVFCRKYLDKSDAASKRQAYDEICKRCSPVFRFFLMEKFGHNKALWHAAQQRYTRSVAVSSVVGHVLGIGDRHTSNILVHKKTGEVVHIDFGIVFEQGKLLNVAERVPFRLTRNVVDGMGPCGTTGTFARSAEETTKTLRGNSKAVMTILSAIVADPLYRFKVSPVEAKRRQGLLVSDQQERPSTLSRKKKAEKNGSENGNTSEADDQGQLGSKAISKIYQKLQGYEDATSGEQQGVEGQVQLLVNSARDPDNLCRMFSGWMPFL